MTSENTEIKPRKLRAFCFSRYVNLKVVYPNFRVALFLFFFMCVQGTPPSLNKPKLRFAWFPTVVGEPGRKFFTLFGGGGKVKNVRP